MRGRALRAVGNTDFKVALVALGILAMAELGWLLFISQFERWPVIRRAQQAEEVRKDASWAAKELLRARGLEVQELQELSLSALPPPDCTLVILDSRFTLAERSTEQLLSWVEAGGHLVVVAQPPEAEHAEEEESSGGDLLLQALGLGAFKSPAGPMTVWQSRLWPEDTPVELSPRPTIALYYASDDAASQVWWEVSDADNARVIHMQRGQGAVTIWPSAQLVSNKHLNQGDNVWLLWETATTHGERPVVWAPQLEVLSLGEVIWGNGWPLVLAALIWLLLFLAAHMPRFGPMMPEPDARRRSLLEHVEASARLLWQHGGVDRLLEACQAAVRRKASGRIAGWNRLSPQEQKKHLAALTSLTIQEVEFGLGLSRDARDFTERVRCLERMRKKL